MVLRWSRCAVVGIALCALSCATFGGPEYQGPAGEHFDGRQFQNIEPFAEQRVLDFIRWQFMRKPGPWADEPARAFPAPPRRVGRGELRVTFINHATVLIQMDDVNVLTDPVWSDRVGPYPWAGPHRHRPPGVPLDSLPPIDIVLLSHNHYDHLDIPTLRRLTRQQRPRILTGLGTLTLLESNGIPGGEDMNWWQSTRSGRLRVTAVPAQHWSGRGLLDHRTSLWMGFVLETASDTVYFAGDTGDGIFLDRIHARFPSIRLALLPIAPMNPRWYMRRKHMGPADALRADQLLGARTMIPIHFGTFDLGDDRMGEPVDSLRTHLQRMGPCAPRVWVLENGEGRDIPAEAGGCGAR